MINLSTVSLLKYNLDGYTVIILKLFNHYFFFGFISITDLHRKPFEDPVEMMNYVRIKHGIYISAYHGLSPAI